MPLLHIGGYEWLDWHLHPDVILWLLLLSGAYCSGVVWLRPRTPDAARVKRSQVVMFSLGVLVLYLAAGTPLHELSERYLLSAHMLQHLLFTLVAPPLLLLGTPAWLLRPLLQVPLASRLARALTRPLFTFALFNAVLLLTHLPPVVDLSLHQHGFHFFIHLVLVASALLMWWPVFSPLPELPHLSYPLQMAYLFGQSLLPVVMASFITFSDRVVYPFYAAAPRLWNISAVEDQQIAGLTMKILGSLILWLVIAIVFFQWYNREEFEASRSLKWQDVENELERMGLTKR